MKADAMASRPGCKQRGPMHGQMRARGRAGGQCCRRAPPPRRRVWRVDAAGAAEGGFASAPLREGGAAEAGGGGGLSASPTARDRMRTWGAPQRGMLVCDCWSLGCGVIAPPVPPHLRCVVRLRYGHWRGGRGAGRMGGFGGAFGSSAGVSQQPRYLGSLSMQRRGRPTIDRSPMLRAGLHPS